MHLVSSTKQQGVSSLLAELQRTAGVSGDVWVVSPPLPLWPAWQSQTRETCMAHTKKDVLARLLTVEWTDRHTPASCDVALNAA